jgi:hypothetical protein
MSAGLASPGISVKDILQNGERPDEADGFNHSHISDEGLSNECFYRLCEKKKSCKDRVTLCSFKSSIHSLLCMLLTLNLFCLFTAVIGPVVSLSIIVYSPIILIFTFARFYIALRMMRSIRKWSSTQTAPRLMIYGTPTPMEKGLR